MGFASRRSSSPDKQPIPSSNMEPKWIKFLEQLFSIFKKQPAVKNQTAERRRRSFDKAPTRSPTGVPVDLFDCETKDVWSEDKKWWCCRRKGKGLGCNNTNYDDDDEDEHDMDGEPSDVVFDCQAG